MIRKMVSMMKYGDPLPVGMDDDAVHVNRENEIENDRVTSRRALGHLKDPVAIASELLYSDALPTDLSQRMCRARR
jgi:hypothetical protein